MKKQPSNRTRLIGIRLSPAEYMTLDAKWKQTTCRKLSDYVRRCLFDKPVVTTIRDRSLDDFMTEAIRLRGELNAIGNNLNQAVKKLNTLQHLPQYKDWIEAFQQDKELLFITLEHIKTIIQKCGEKWLQ